MLASFGPSTESIINLTNSVLIFCVSTILLQLLMGKPNYHAAKLRDFMIESYPSETQEACQSLGIPIETLKPEENYPKLTQIQHSHVLQVAMLLQDRVEDVSDLKSLIQKSRIKKRPKRKSRSMMAPVYSAFAFSFPSKMIKDCFSREKQKYSRGKAAIQRMISLNSELYQRNQRIMEDLDTKYRRIEEDKQKFTEHLVKTAQGNYENRQKHLDAKSRIVKQIDDIWKQYGQNLELRMSKLNEQQKQKLRKQLAQKFKKLREHLQHQFRKQVLQEKEIIKEENFSLLMLNKLINKQENRISKFEDNIKMRIQMAQQHADKVNRVLSSSLSKYEEDVRTKLASVMEKSLRSNERMEQKSAKTRQNAFDVKTRLEQKVSKQTTEFRKLMEQKESRVKQYDIRVSKVDQARVKAQKMIERQRMHRMKYNSQRTHIHAISYSKNIEELFREKDRILERHHRNGVGVDELARRKSELSYKKRESTLELRKLRGEIESPEKTMKRRNSTQVKNSDFEYQIRENYCI